MNCKLNQDSVTTLPSVRNVGKHGWDEGAQTSVLAAYLEVMAPRALFHLQPRYQLHLELVMAERALVLDEELRSVTQSGLVHSLFFGQI